MKKVFILAVLLIIVIAGYLILNKPKPQQTKLTPQTAKQSEPEPKPAIDEALQKKISDWAATQPADYAVDIRELDGQLRLASYQSEKSMVPASTYKIYAAYAVLKKIEQAEYTLQSKTRTGASIDKCLELMIVQSDNDCGRAIGFLIGWEEINQMLRSIGIKNTNMNNYDSAGNLLSTDKSTTATELALVLEKLDSGQLLNMAHTEKLINLMKRQVWRERLASGLPLEIEIASKPGWLTGIQTDAGIVYGPKSKYVIVVLSNASSPKPLSELSKTVYDYLQK